MIGYDPVFGARPVKRVIQQKIENSLANLILGKKLSSNSKVTIDFDNDDFKFSIYSEESIST